MAPANGGPSDRPEAARPRVLVASQNPGKAREIARLLAGVEVLSLADVAPVSFPEEGGDYGENARTKARVAAEATGLISVGDDSGLEVAYATRVTGKRTRPAPAAPANSRTSRAPGARPRPTA